MNKLSLNLFSQCCLCIICGWVVLAIIFPDQLLLRSTRFMHVMDTEVPFENTFTIASQLSRMHIDIFNGFDGVSWAFAHLTNGVYTLSNMIVAGLYCIFASFIDDQAKFFHEFYSVMFFSINYVIRSLGGFLLAGLFTQRLWVKMIALIYLNVIFTQYLMNNGMMVNNLVSFMPLVIYFLIRAWQSLSFRDLICVVLVLALCLSNALLETLSFFYLSLHGLIVLLGVSLIVMRRDQCTKALCKLGSRSWWLRHRNLCVWGGLGVGCLLLPLLFWAQLLTQDFYMADSGLGSSQGRIANMFNIEKYFHSSLRIYPEMKNFLLGLVDFRFPAWGWSWPFISAGGVLFIGLGLVFARNILPYILSGAFIWLLCLNIPAQPTHLSSWAHWINVLTNPVQFLVRSIHMADVLGIILLWPLVVVGLNGIGACADKEGWAMKRCRWAIAVVLIIACGYGLFSPWEVGRYVVLVACVLGIALIIVRIKQLHPWIMILLLLFVLFLDLKATSFYVNGDLLKNRFITQSDYRNPLVLPWINEYRRESQHNNLLPYGFLNTYGFYYGFSPLEERFTRVNSLYEPRHMIFRDLPHDEIAKTYLSRDGRMIFLADFAVEETSHAWSEIIKYQFDRRVIVVEPKAQKTGRVQHLDKISTLPLIVDSIPLRSRIDLSQATMVTKDNKLWAKIQIPKALKHHVVLSDASPYSETLHIFLNGKKMLVNINHRHKGFMFVRMSTALTTSDVMEMEIIYPKPIVQINKWHADTLHVKIHADHDGWLAFHWPYDKKWTISIDGQKKEVFKVNRYFFGTPILKGDHDVVVAYMPQSFFRILIGIMMLAICAIFIFLIKEGFRVKPRKT